MLCIPGARVTFGSLTQRGDELCEQIKPVFACVHFVRDFCGHNRNYAGNVIELGSVIDTYAVPCNNFVRFELRFVNVVFDALVWRNANEVVTECAASFFCRNEVLEFNAFESRVFAPCNILERFCVARKSEFTVIEFLEKFFFPFMFLF